MYKMIKIKMEMQKFRNCCDTACCYMDFCPLRSLPDLEDPFWRLQCGLHNHKTTFVYLPPSSLFTEPNPDAAPFCLLAGDWGVVQRIKIKKDEILSRRRRLLHFLVGSPEPS